MELGRECLRLLGAPAARAAPPGDFWVRGFGRLCGANDPGSCANSYVPKLYADTLVFYAALCAFTLGAAVFCAAQPVAAAGPPTPTPTPLARARALLLRRVRVPLARACGSWHPYPLGASVGELLLVGQVLALYAYWLWCWPS